MRYRRTILPLLFAVHSAAAVTAYADEEVRAIVRHGDQIRALLLKIEGNSVLVPLLACGSLLNSEIHWDRQTNRWKLSRDDAVASGFLDEPLVILSGKPFLVGKPPRLIKGRPYMSLEILKMLGRHGWEIDISYDENSEELLVREVRAQPAETVQRVRAITLPEVPAGARVLVLDAGHSRTGGIRIMGNRPAGGFSLELARAVSATMTRAGRPVEGNGLGEGLPEGEPGPAVVVLQGDEEELEPSEVASIVNALKAEAFVSFHMSSLGAPGVAVWCWSDRNMVKTGVDFDPFERPPEGQRGWATAARHSLSSSVELANRMIASLEGTPFPPEGPYLAPLLPLEGLTCPAVVIDILGAATPEGAALLNSEEAIGALAGAIARGLIQDAAKGETEP